jgi:DNA (cytosine-5)-methyltransferase 1
MSLVHTPTDGRPATGGLRALRQEAKLKLADLASLSNVPLDQLKQVERGLCELDPSQAALLARALGVSMSTLLAEHAAFSSRATPGEGYTTSKRANLRISAPTVRLPDTDKRARVLDLFCGCGGLSYGFESTGAFVTVGGIDLLQDRVDSFTANHAHAMGFAGDITEIQPSKVSELVGRVDVVVGGPPCQGFSSIRPFRNLTERDPRNNLVEHYVLMIAELRPKWFVFENVVGLVSHEGGKKLDAIIEAFEEAGFTVSWRVVNAASFGVPQNRERVVIVGNAEGKTFDWPRPTHHVEYRSMSGRRAELLSSVPLFDGVLPPAITVMQAIADLPPVASGRSIEAYTDGAELTPYQRSMRQNERELTWHRATAHSEKMLNIIRHAGNCISDLPPGLVTSGFSSCYSRLDADRPSTTITVNFVHPSSNRCIHPVQDRALTPREGARLQSFPDKFNFRGTTAQVVKQIGNAVPPRLGEVLARSIAAHGI